MAGDGEEVREEPEQVREQHEHEQREDQREKLHSLAAGRVAQHVGHELVGHLRHRLEAGRHQRAVSGQNRKAPAAAAVAAMKAEELVKEKSTPPISIGISLEMWN